eukprot:350981-Chlamydomonas_euryale.AAC.3
MTPVSALGRAPASQLPEGPLCAALAAALLVEHPTHDARVGVERAVYVEHLLAGPAIAERLVVVLFPQQQLLQPRKRGVAA